MEIKAERILELDTLYEMWSQLENNKHRISFGELVDWFKKENFRIL